MEAGEWLLGGAMGGAGGWLLGRAMGGAGGWLLGRAMGGAGEWLQGGAMGGAGEWLLGGAMGGAGEWLLGGAMGGAGGWFLSLISPSNLSTISLHASSFASSLVRQGWDCLVYHIPSHHTCKRNVCAPCSCRGISTTGFSW